MIQSEPKTLSCQRDQFSLPEDVTYLNCSYMGPLLKSVEEAGIGGLRLKRAPHTIGHQEFFEDVELLRQAFADIIHADEPRRIVVVPSVSYGMAVVARNLRIGQGENIVVPGEQFPSNVYPWMKLARQKGAGLRTVNAPEAGENRGKSWNEHLLEAIDAQTRLVAVAQVHWSDGTRFDLKALRQRTREVGALLAVDGTQSVGALPFDLREVQPDALVCAGYKWLMGPYAISLAYFGPYFDDGEPLEEGWISRHGSEDFSGLVNYQDAYQPAALRYEMGERSNFIQVPMMLEALRQIQAWEVDRIQDYCARLSEPAIAELLRHGYQIEKPTFRGSHLFGVRLPARISMDKLRKFLAEERVVVSVRGDSVRVSPYLYNKAADLEKLIRCFEAAGQ